MNWSKVWLTVVIAASGSSASVRATAAALDPPIAFIAPSSGGVPHIFLKSPNSNAPTQLTSGPYPDNSYSWSPDGTKLAVWREEDGEAIYTMNADGSGIQRLSPSPSYDIFPNWSPDRTRLVFCHVLDPGSGPPHQIVQIDVMSTDGSNVQTLLSNDTFNMEPRWSPDGSKIVFMSTLGGDGVQIYTMNADGSDITELTDVGNNGDPAWSPDGSQISFGSSRVSNELNIFTMNADGSNLKQITNFVEPAEAGDTAWSTDGTRIVFERDVGGDYQSNPNAQAQVWVMNSDGSDQQTMGENCSAVGCSPRWQP
jgi:Tol biopolymer transport system component